ncbi:MAG: phage Gp37/Gp68 family protein [Lachnospiraceae bacterium]|nr:phage Gp37/Gp68 family protein [Lachnospiraceae bacterium]
MYEAEETDMNWEPWTVCSPYSEGCKYCYFYGPYAKRYGQNEVKQTDKFDWPVRRNAKGELCIKGGKIIATCFATDFFLPEADAWRKEVWAMIIFVLSDKTALYSMRTNTGENRSEKVSSWG